MIKRVFTVILFLIALLPLIADISQIPEAQLLIDQALQAYEEENYNQSLEIFRQASILDPENPHILSFLESLGRIVSLENYESDSQTIDSFIEKRSEEKKEIKETPENRENQDFITRENNKEIARQERPIGGMEFFFPLFYSSVGNWELDDSFKRNSDPFKGIGYSIEFFPDLFNRIIGIEGKYESYSLSINNTNYIYDDARFGVILKNYFNEQPGSYSLLGTKISVGMLFGENTDDYTRQMIPSWQLELFVRDPLLLRFFQNDFSRNLGFEGKFQFSLLETTYMLGYGAKLEFQMGDFLLASQFKYRNLLDNDIMHSAWMLSAGVKYYFR
jgi:hypothetical protein